MCPLITRPNLHSESGFFRQLRYTPVPDAALTDDR
jgi:hypothetical protein